MKRCPFCAEEIQDAAIVCKHCGRDLVATAVCATCGERLEPDAVKCSVCGAARALPPAPPKPTAAAQPSPATTTIIVQNDGPSPGIAALLSLIIPGAGQMYAGSVGVGIVFLILVPIGYVMFVVPGLLLHVVCIFSAASTARDARAVARQPAAAAAPRASPITPTADAKPASMAPLVIIAGILLFVAFVLNRCAG